MQLLAAGAAAVWHSHALTWHHAACLLAGAFASGTLNAVIGAITSPLVAFGFPAAAYSWLHRTRALQQASLTPPPRWAAAAVCDAPGTVLGARAHAHISHLRLSFSGGC